jgi:hypothetical protein
MLPPAQIPTKISKKMKTIDVSQQSNNFWKNLEKLLFSSSWSHWTIFKLISYDPLTIVLKTEGALVRIEQAKKLSSAS